MEKRYQIFVSSTYADLKEERRAVIQSLLEMDCIPAGMELFPAVDEEQFSFIKKIIDDSDYYVVIIGGRYGSTASDGLSYTELEYDHARERGMQVLAFIHDKPEEISVRNSDLDPNLRHRLQAFRDKVTKGAVVKMWHDAKELPGLVALSLTKTIKAHPAVGWIRADRVTTAEALQDLNSLHKQLEALRERNTLLESAAADSRPRLKNLAGLEESYDIYGSCKLVSYVPTKWKVPLTWSAIFSGIAPYILEHPNDALMKHHFTQVVLHLCKLRLREKQAYDHWRLEDEGYETVKIQFIALNLVDVDMQVTAQGSMALFWSLTDLGTSVLLDLRTVKKAL